MQRPNRMQMALVGAASLGVGCRALKHAATMRGHRGLHHIVPCTRLGSISSARTFDPTNSEPNSIPSRNWASEIFTGTLLLVFVAGAGMTVHSAVMAKAQNAIPEYVIRAAVGGTASIVAAVVSGVRLVLRLDGGVTQSQVKSYYLTESLKDLKQDVRTNTTSIKDAKTELNNGIEYAKKDLKEDIKGVKDDMKDLKKDLKEDIKGVKEDIKDLKKDIKKGNKDLNRDINKKFDKVLSFMANSRQENSSAIHRAPSKQIIYKKR